MNHPTHCPSCECKLIHMEDRQGDILNVTDFCPECKWNESQSLRTGHPNVIRRRKVVTNRIERYLK